ncbi:response regulator transcription factor [Polynucleobacter sp. CS-Odin-A6]|uniref:response regulator transcription factor n=1 Tax=Polynucleobacter sp. CS-Odin-A6 TaxID=2689106 RepID=UPI0021030E44|nr:response regulator [Polynucleobacter sp. CS-Odin-A6]
MHTKKVIIVDDEPIILAGLENWLSRDYKILGHGSAQTFLEAFQQFDFKDGLPTCILLDLQMPGMNGIELQASIKAINAEIPIIFMSGNAQQADIINAWRGGAVDFILKPFTPAQVTEVLEKQFSVIQNYPENKHQSAIKPLIDIPITKREAEVLLLLGNGQQQIEVAQTLGISIRTVKMYRSNLKEKLGLDSLADLAKYCNQHERSIEAIAKN